MKIRERGNPALHFVDRYLGIPMVAFFGRIRRKRAMPSSIETIGLLKAGAIGDTVLISAVIADLRAAFPRASLIFFAGSTNFEIARMLKGVDRVVKVPITNPGASLRSIRSLAVEMMLDFGQWSRADALLSLFSKAAFTVGFRTPGQHRHRGYDLTVEHSSDIHELDNFRRLVSVLGVETRNVPFLSVQQRGRPRAQDYAVFQLWPGGRRRELKQWPLERWLLLVEQFAKWGIEVALTGAPADRGRNEKLIGSVSRLARDFVRNAAGALLEETAATLAAASLVVSVDTGLMHMAAALGVPLVALHGPTSPKRWGPISHAAVVVESPLASCGYISLGWERPSNPPACMEAIRFDVVRDACRELLQKQKSSQRDGLVKVPYTTVSEESKA